MTTKEVIAIIKYSQALIKHMKSLKYTYAGDAVAHSFLVGYLIAKTGGASEWTEYAKTVVGREEYSNEVVADMIDAKITKLKENKIL